MMNERELGEFLRERFPQVGNKYEIVKLTDRGIDVRLKVREQDLRPGGTVSGPSIFALADVSVYLALLSRIGPMELAVTTNCSINFMRKPPRTDLLGRARILKLGHSLCVCEVDVYADGVDGMIAHAVLTYSIPRRKKCGNNIPHT